MFHKPMVILAYCTMVIVRASMCGIKSIPWWLGLIFLLLIRDVSVSRINQVTITPEEQAKIDSLADELIRDAEKGLEDDNG